MKSIRRIDELSQMIGELYWAGKIDGWKANRMLRALERELWMHQDITDLCKPGYNHKLN